MKVLFVFMALFLASALPGALPGLPPFECDGCPPPAASLMASASLAN